MRTRHVSARITTLSAGWVLVAVGLTGCGGRDDSTQSPATRAAAPQIIEVTRVIQQPVDVTLSMPGQLEPYQTVAIYPKITAFVKAIRVDRGSRVRAGELIAELEAPELVAQRAEAQSKLQAAEAQLAVAQSKAEADTSTFDRLEAASATPGVVAGNDLVLAQKAVEVDQNQITAAQQSAEAARQALQAVVQMEGYLRVAAPVFGHRDRAERPSRCARRIQQRSDGGDTDGPPRTEQPTAARCAGARSVRRGGSRQA
jgi:multidrug efflux pump subunit AcrA (membrane-fusion protein)